jgi:hypothetical protein
MAIIRRRQLAWFVGLWAGGVVALAVVAGLVRIWLA